MANRKARDFSSFKKREVNPDDVIWRKTQRDILEAITRYVWSRHPWKKEVVQRCRAVVQVGIHKNGNPIYRVKAKCEQCQKIVDKVDVDHMAPKIDPNHGFQGYDKFVEMCIVKPAALQGLCKECHTIKTVAEGGVRTETRREKRAQVKSDSADKKE